MGLQLNESLITEFRDSINRNNYLMEKYKNVDGKNFLNIIYSAMDWLNVAVDGLSSIELEYDGFGYDHVNTVKLMQYLITVDLINESISQLYRVLDDKSNYPYSNTKQIFNQTDVSDDNYFKHLRAAFGTHPVNLTSINGKKDNNGTRYYASWPSNGRILDYDFIVSLYSNDVLNDESVFMGINIKEIDTYAEERYNLLQNFIDISENMNQDHFNTMIHSEITFNNNHYEQTSILLSENEKRFGKYRGYENKLEYINYILRVNYKNIEFKSFDKTIIDEYVDYIISLIPIIKENMQQMRVKPISKNINAIGYEFEKIYMFLSDGKHPIGEEYFFGLVKFGELPDELLEEVNFPLYSLVFDSYLHRKTKDLGRVFYIDLVPEGTISYPNPPAYLQSKNE